MTQRNSRIRRKNGGYDGKEYLRFIPLGGLGEIGKNMYVLEYGDEIIVIDSGLKFPDSELPGIDYIVPDISYLEANKDKILAIIITHGHEDHTGALPYVLPRLNAPLYGTQLTLGLIRNKLQEDLPLYHPDMHEIRAGDVIKIGSFTIRFIAVAHSIPDGVALSIDTPLGRIVHTGDFKIDLTPVGPGAEYDKLAKLGTEGVLVLLSDSTNALRPGFTESEKKIGASIKELFKQVENRIIVATFASNMFRVQQIVEACIQTNRKIAVFGRSMEKTIEVGQQVGYIKAPKGTIIQPEEIDMYDANELCLLCTGSQGEPLAALSRIANGSHRLIKLIPGDTIIFSSNPIPGNQEGVNKTINQLFKKGANVIVHSPIADTHTTGHASQGELKLMLNLF